MKVAILGSGAYGIALASIFYTNKHEVVLYTPIEEERKELNKTRVSNKLKNYKIPTRIKITTDLELAVKKSDLIVMCVPAFAVDGTAKELSKIISKKQHIMIASKGIENDTCLFLADVLRKYIDTDKYAVLSGPTFAVDIVTNTPVGLSLASTNPKTIKLIKKLMENKTTKLRETSDVIGIEVCGSVKNVMAIASGMLDGLNATDSTKALFLTEVINDIKNLIDALGGSKKTILSFAGFGDIYMTCSSENSRNFTFGKLIGSGKSRKEINDYLKNTTVEGVYTLKSVLEIIKREKIKMPIVELINDIINGKEKKEKLLEFLITKK